MESIAPHAHHLKSSRAADKPPCTTPWGDHQLSAPHCQHKAQDTGSRTWDDLCLRSRCIVQGFSRRAVSPGSEETKPGEPTALR